MSGSPTAPNAVTRGRHGRLLLVLAVLGAAIAGYLLAVRIAGQPPVCGPIAGCDQVATSEYATVLGMPVALFGLGFSLVLAGLAFAWWRSGARPVLLGLYGLAVLGVFAVGYLTFLEIFVIEAICVWCVAYAVTVVALWLGAAVAVRRTG